MELPSSFTFPAYGTTKVKAPLPVAKKKQRNNSMPKMHADKNVQHRRNGKRTAMHLTEGML